MKKSIFVLLAVLGMAAVEAKGQVPIGVEEGCPSKNIGGFTINNQNLLRLYCFYCYGITDLWTAHYTCDNQTWAIGSCISCIKVEVYDGPLGDPSRGRVLVTFVPTGDSWVVYNDSSTSGIQDDYTYWEFELVGP